MYDAEYEIEIESWCISLQNSTFYIWRKKAKQQYLLYLLSHNCPEMLDWNLKSLYILTVSFYIAHSIWFRITVKNNISETQYLQV